MKQLAIFTDGACYPNPGTGGWAYVIVDEKKVILHQKNGGEKNTTNNRMELKALIESLRWLSNKPDYYSIHVFTDSTYVINVVNRTLMNHFFNLNKDLIKELSLLMNKHEVSCHHVKAHSGIKMNELADSMAMDYMNSLIDANEKVPDAFKDLLK